jgi:hypothetical protein
MDAFYMHQSSVIKGVVPDHGRKLSQLPGRPVDFDRGAGIGGEWGHLAPWVIHPRRKQRRSEWEMQLIRSRAYDYGQTWKTLEHAQPHPLNMVW